MATISNSARISGLASGLDIESIIDGLTQGTQTKIEKSKQDLQILEWKKESYQSITDSLFAFQNKYCGTSSKSMPAVDELKRLTASSSSSYVTVDPTVRSTAERIYIGDIISLASSAKVTGTSRVSANPTLTANPALLSDLGGKSMRVTLDGAEKTLTFRSGAYASTGDAATELQSMLNGAFGSGRISVGVNGDVISLDAGNSAMTISNSGISGNEVSGVLSFKDGASNRLNLTASLADSNLKQPPSGDFSFTINGVTFSIPPSSTIQSIIEKINASDAGVTISYSQTTDTFSLIADETGSASAVTYTDDSGSFLSSILGAGNRTAGTDAVIRVGFNGDTSDASLVTLTRSSNTFDINGTTFTLNGKAAGTEAEGINVSVGLDGENAAKKITEFVGAYNALLKTISDKLNESVYKGYKPLTEDQKKDLTDTEIETWTEKAKSGLLNNDSVLKSLYNQLRGAMTDAIKKADGSTLGMTLGSIGITSSSYAAKGELTINPDKLLAALKNNQSAVLSMFTQASNIGFSNFLTNDRATERYRESGLLWRISDIVKTNLSTVGNTGALVNLVGSPSNAYMGQTEYSKKINKSEDKIDDLLDRLQKEEDAYWKKYTALETAMSQLNSMSGYLSSMLSA